MKHGTLDQPVDRMFEITWAEVLHRLLQGGELAWDVLDGKERVKWLME